MVLQMVLQKVGLCVPMVLHTTTQTPHMHYWMMAMEHLGVSSGVSLETPEVLQLSSEVSQLFDVVSQLFETP